MGSVDGEVESVPFVQKKGDLIQKKGGSVIPRKGERQKKWLCGKGKSGALG